ncbi:MAG: bifunctional ADP-dependent NAD(P)H-hydrate dehydratase/NAD(P)H-hydrate epimerase [Roseivirga sp.]
MQKILSADQTRAADQFTIRHESIASADLMERASSAFVDEFLQKVPVGTEVTVVCGPGNNGGDGLAIARMLLSRDFEVRSFLINISPNLSEDCAINLDRLKKISKVQLIEHPQAIELTEGVVIDAIFGSGLNRPVDGLAGEVIERINASGLPVVSVDIPSGLFADEVNLAGKIIRACATITFQLPKLSFLIPESGRFVEEWYAVDIGLSAEFINAQDSKYSLIDAGYVSGVLPVREKFGHKGSYGRVQLVAGSLGKMGAACLCGEACLKSGAGLLTIHVPRVGLNVVQTVLKEAMATADICETHVSDIPLLQNTDVICLGPGLGTADETTDALHELLKKANVPMVIDADALNIIAKTPALLKHIPERSVLTPHVGEFERLFGKQPDGLARIEKMREISVTNRLIVVLKGAHTAVSDESGQVFFNTTGNSGMATAGSGDVLAGVIAGLMAQGLSGKDAAICGVFLHGMAGDFAENKVGKMSLMASNLLNELHRAISNVTITSIF